MSMKKFMLSWVEHEKSFISLGPALDIFNTYLKMSHDIKEYSLDLFPIFIYILSVIF